MSSVEICLVSFALFIGILLFAEAGRRTGQRKLKKHPEDSGAGFPAVDGSVFALMGLLIAFSFSAAASRYEARRQLIVQEANAIGSSWLRIDLLPAPRQEQLRETLRSYVDNHLSMVRGTPNMQVVREGIARARDIQRDMWSQAVTACREAPSPATAGLVLPVLTGMFEVMNARVAALNTHLPQLILWLLLILPLICSFLAGLSSAPHLRRSWIQILGFAAILSIAMYVILDVEYPRAGLVRLDVFDQALIDVRNSM